MGAAEAGSSSRRGRTRLVPPIITPELHAARVLLCAKGVTQAEIAAFLGVSTGYLSRVLTGYEHRPDVMKALWIALSSKEFDQALAEARG